MKTVTTPDAATLPDELAEVRPVFERGEDAPELVAVRELRGAHDVEQAVAEDLLDGGPIVVGQDARDPLADASDELPVGYGRIECQERPLDVVGRRVVHEIVEDSRDDGQRLLVLGRAEGHERLLDRALARGRRRGSPSAR